MHPRQAASSYTPTSPLSPRLRPSASRQSSNPDVPRRPNADLSLGKLPRFHPVLYELQPPSSSTSVPPLLTSAPISSGPSRPPHAPQHYYQQQHQRQVSDAQKALQQYQREVINNAARAAALLGPAEPKSETPRAPHIVPCDSPGPATPLVLETGEADYMTAQGGSIGEGSPRSLVDQMVRQETDRRSLHSRHSSPTVSPRC